MRAIILSLLLTAGAANAQPLVNCNTAADSLLKIWPELKAVGGVKSGTELRASADASWNVPAFAFWRASMEKQKGSRDLVWNSVIIQADALLQCNIAALPAGQKPPQTKDLAFYYRNRAAVLRSLVIG
jgi:hypothetical protein